MLALAWGLVRSVGRLPGAGTCMGAGAVCREITRCWHLHGGLPGICDNRCSPCVRP